MENNIIGIDLGTTNSVVSVLKNNRPETLLVDGEKLLPSVVSLTRDGFIVGKVAKNMAILEPERTIASIKRKMGQDVEIPIGERRMRPEEISALILQKIRQTALAHYGLPADGVLRAVVTVPAYFTEEQRAATKQAAELAHLQVERIINEPTAAALAFGMSQMEEATYVIYDFGGGTFDVSVIESNDGLVEVLSTTGDNMLGGDDLDHLLAQHLWGKFLASNGLPASLTPGTKENARLLRIAEQSKIRLSTETEIEIQESFFFKQNDLNYHIEEHLLRSDFEELIREKVQQTILLVRRAIADAKLDLDDPDGILLVGGSSRIPLISSMITEQLRMEPQLIDLPDEAVSHGATVQGAIINGLDLDTVLVDITPHSLGIGTLDDRSYSSIFARHLKAIEKEGEEEEEEEDKDLAASSIIPKNTPVPVRRSQLFSAVVPFQRGYEIKVYQGEGDRFVDNRIIGQTHLQVGRPIEDGCIEVTFHLDLDGLLKVTAIETTTREVVKAEFTSSRGIKVQKNKVEHDAVLTTEVADTLLLKRAETLSASGKLSDADAKDLAGLTERLKSHLAAGDQPAVEQTEAELLDLLYYLEEEK